MRNTFKILAAASALAVSAAAHASIIAIGTSGTVAPTSNPNLSLSSGGSTTLYLWAGATGTGYISTLSFSLQGLLATSNGLSVSASNFTWLGNFNPKDSSGNAIALPAPVPNALTGSPSGQTNGIQSNGLNTALFGNVSITSGQDSGLNQVAGLKPVASFTLTFPTGTATGSLGIFFTIGSGRLLESPTTAVTHYFGFGGTQGTGAATSGGVAYTGLDNSAINTTGTVASGAGAAGFPITQAAGSRSSAADATITVTAPATGPTFAVNGVTSPSTTVAGNGISYTPTLLGANGSFTMGGTPTGPILVALDFSGQTSYDNFFASLPAGDTDVTALYKAYFNAQAGLGGSFDVIIQIPVTQSGTVAVGNLGGVVLNNVAVVPEPASATLGLAALALPALSRRRRA